MNNLEQIVAQYYTDINGNPMSYHIVRKFTISPNNYQIQLDGIYDKHKGVEVIEPEGLFRVYNHDEIAPNKYFVRADGNVFFDSSMASKTVKVDYYSIGLPCIGAGRIYTLLDDKGNVIETLQDILKAGQLVVDSLKTMGDVKIVIDEIQTSKTEALKCRENLDEGIDDANKLYSKLNSVDYVQKNQFVQTVDRIDNDFDNTDKRISAEVDTINKKLDTKVNKTDLDNDFAKLDVTINGISGRVNNAVTQDEFTKFKQSSNDFKLEIQNTSRYNFVSNPIFSTGDLKNWQIWGNGTSYDVKADTSLGHNYSLKLQCFKQGQGVMQTISGFVYGKTYTFKAKIYVEEGTPGLMVRNDSTWNGITFDPKQGLKKWIDIKMTFWAKEGTMPIYIGNVSKTTATSTFWVSEVMLYEGDLDIPFIDRIKEIYSNDFQVDVNGVKCTFEDGSYASMGHNGFEWYNSDTGHSYHALAYVTSFGIPAGNPGKVEIKLPKEFTKRESSLKWTVALRGYYYETSGNFFPMQVHVTGANHHIDENGLIVCPVQGYCKIQNATNMEDKQDRDVTAMLIAIA